MGKENQTDPLQWINITFILNPQTLRTISTIGYNTPQQLWLTQIALIAHFLRINLQNLSLYWLLIFSLILYSDIAPSMVGFGVIPTHNFMPWVKKIRCLQLVDYYQIGIWRFEKPTNRTYQNTNISIQEEKHTNRTYQNINISIQEEKPTTEHIET